MNIFNAHRDWQKATWPIKWDIGDFEYQSISRIDISLVERLQLLAVAAIVYHVQGQMYRKYLRVCVPRDGNLWYTRNRWHMFLNIKLCRDFHFWHSFIAGAAIVNLILQSNTKYAIKLQQWIIIFQYVFICIACISYVSITEISHTIDAFRMPLLMYASHRPLYFHCVLYMFGICAGMAPIKLCGPLIHPYMLLECIPASYMYM